MIIGTGIDLIEIDRIAGLLERFSERFLKRVFTSHEQSGAPSRNMSLRVAYFAKRFAAKEAFVKALGTGFSNGIVWTEITLSKTSIGQPRLKCTGHTQKILHSLLPQGYTPVIHLSLSDTRNYACALVTIEARKAVLS